MNIEDIDAHFMRLALKEARKGQWKTSPNPCVGALVIKNGEIIGKGYHKKAGTPHAEIHALNDAGEHAAGSTVYVTLEPCNHAGRTPPCSHALVKSRVKRVVVGMGDPNPLVDGSGNSYLRAHGVDVTEGVLEEQCRAINLPFIKYITTRTPWVMMKAGVSLDGRISYQKGIGGRLTGPESSRYVHRLRHRMDAILVGIGTVEADNPSLTS
ncbi:MAG: bifunctional diaminohydroxyphosphoribosylaminopyrimidine deaminase/5-amino-6-(5-phosphoribosylamino)uracil reductase RibD, partial [Thermodesulfobacteriota bacterium]